MVYVPVGLPDWPLASALLEWIHLHRRAPPLPYKFLSKLHFMFTLWTRTALLYFFLTQRIFCSGLSTNSTQLLFCDTNYGVAFKPVITCHLRAAETKLRDQTLLSLSTSHIYKMLPLCAVIRKATTTLPVGAIVFGYLIPIFNFCYFFYRVLREMLGS